jgi:hypothetical protein
MLDGAAICVQRATKLCEEILLNEALDPVKRRGVEVNRLGPRSVYSPADPGTVACILKVLLCNWWKIETAILE